MLPAALTEHGMLSLPLERPINRGSEQLSNLPKVKRTVQPSGPVLPSLALTVTPV